MGFCGSSMMNVERVGLRCTSENYNKVSFKQVSGDCGARVGYGWGRYTSHSRV